VVFGTTSISVPATELPRLIELVSEVIDTRLVEDVMAADVSRAVFARRVTEVEAEMAAVMFTVRAVDLTDTAPAVDVIVAPELLTACEPESVISPLARTAPVGATDVPPLMVTVPFVAVSVPAPE
jgi:hypothetical protein